MTARYPKAVKPNYALNMVNVFAMPIGQPKLADDDWFVTSVDMKNGTYTLLHSGVPGDGLARVVTVTVTGDAVDSGDTLGTVTINGTDVNGSLLSEEVIPSLGVETTEAAFLHVTSVVGAGWAATGGTDHIKVGFGASIGMTSDFYPAATSIVIMALVDGITTAFTQSIGGSVATWTVDASGGTYDGSKFLTLLIARGQD